MSENTGSAQQSSLILKQVIPFMGKYNLWSTPVNYAVIYEYYLGNNETLIQTIDKTLSSELVLTNAIVQGWFDSFLMDYDLSVFTQTQIDMHQIAGQLTQLTLETEGEVNQFDGSLNDCNQKLNGSVDSSSLAAIVTDLKGSTSLMQLAMGQIKQQLSSTKQEMTKLQNRLNIVSVEAITDSLTGLMNRKGFMDAINRAISEFGRTKSPLFILMLDIDLFKQVNDIYGHSVGDKVIKVVADTITKHTKGKDTVCRYGGEEFAVLLPDTGLDGALSVAENIRRMIETIKLNKMGCDENLVRITISVGIASYVSGQNINRFIDNADTALYQSKNAGRNQCTVFAE